MTKIFIFLSTLALLSHAVVARSRKFPKSLMFGAATAAYQVEGAWDQDGKGESIWDHYTHINSETVDNNGDTSANSYQFYKEDVKILKKMGLKFYKFSVSWSRILPTGRTDEINQSGIDYYNKLINELLRYNIQPMVTLYHFDLPQKLQENGGWTDEAIVKDFEDFARVVFENFSDRVKLWITVHDPYKVCQIGYASGNFPPSKGVKGVDEYICSKNILLAHAKAWRLFDNEYRKNNPGKIGISINVDWKEVSSNETMQLKAAEDARHFYFGLYSHPIFSKYGDFPNEVKKAIAKKSEKQGYPKSRLPALSKKEINLIRGTSDFFGLSHFTTHSVYRNNSLDGSFEEPSFADDVNIGLTVGEQWMKSKSSEWQRSVPFGLYRSLIWVNMNYDYPEVIITELGWSTGLGVSDEDRIQFMRTYMDALFFALDDGSRLLGVAWWSLVDGYDWIQGYKARFGLYEVDFGSPEKTRTPRQSSLVYKEIVRSRVVDLDFKPGDIRMSPERRPKQEL